MNFQEGDVWLDLESILSSSCRRRIIKVLAENGSTNIMLLILKVNGKYPQVNSELRILLEEEIVVDGLVGRMRIMWLNRENPHTAVLVSALKLLDVK
jgi:hypothetical protein